MGVDVEIVPEGKEYALGENTSIVPEGQSMVNYKVESGDTHTIFMAEVANELREQKRE